jgi:hypothetical protein
MAASRYGSDLIQVKPDSHRVVAPVRGGESIGANTLVGIRTADGQAEQVTNGLTTRKVLVATEEINTVGMAHGAFIAKYELHDNIVITLEGTGFTQTNAMGALVYAIGPQSVSLDSATGTRCLVGRVVEFLSATRVRVHVIS